MSLATQPESQPAAAVKGHSRKVLGIFALAMINVAAVLSLRNFPSMALYGWSSITWYVLGAVLFLLPSAFVGAELASGWPKGGGVYAWVKEAFDEEMGFLAIWCEWSENLVWFPTVLAFLAATLAYVIDPSLASNKLFLVVTMLVMFWGTTIANFFGARLSSLLSSVGVIAGSIIPGAVIIVLAFAWLFARKGTQVPFSAHALSPDLSLGNLPFVGTVVLLFAGMEMAGFHALEVRNPQRDYPKAMWLSALIIVLVSIVGTMALAIVIPVKQIDLTAGIVQAFDNFFAGFGVSWATKPMALLIAVGALALLSTWLIGPAKGLESAAQSGDLPKLWRKENAKHVPVDVLVIQAVVATLACLLYVVVPSVNTAYWMLSAMTVQILAIMYILLFASVIRLRYKEPNTPRPYKIPGGKLGIWLVGGAGAIACLFTFVIGFVPPTGLTTQGPLQYVLTMVGGTVMLSLPPFIFYHFRRSGWRASKAEMKAALSATA